MLRSDEQDDGEGGQAATEFAVLMPVYIFLFALILTLGQVCLVRQKVVMAVHLQAWRGSKPGPATDGALSDTVFPAYTVYGGAYTSRIVPISGAGGGADFPDYQVGSDDLTVDPTEYKARTGEDPADNVTPIGTAPPPQPGQVGPPPKPPTAQQSASEIARQAFMDYGADGNPHAHLEYRYLDAQFAYQPGFMQKILGPLALHPNAHCCVLARRLGVERKVYSSGGGANAVTDHHPIEDLNVYPAFTISKDPGQHAGGPFFPPDMPNKNVKGEPDPGTFHLVPDSNWNVTATSGANQDPGGLWSNDLRVGGSPGAEKTFFKSQLGL